MGEKVNLVSGTEFAAIQRLIAITRMSQHSPLSSIKRGALADAASSQDAECTEGGQRLQILNAILTGAALEG